MARHGSEAKTRTFSGAELMRTTAADEQMRQILTFSAHICAQFR